MKKTLALICVIAAMTGCMSQADKAALKDANTGAATIMQKLAVPTATGADVSAAEDQLDLMIDLVSKLSEDAFFSPRNIAYHNMLADDTNFFDLRKVARKRGAELALAGDEVAMAYMWRTSDKFTNEDVVDTATAKQLQLLIVEKSKESKNASTLFMAGTIVANGKIVQRDATQANSLFVKAWRGGERQAAPKLVDLNLDLHDTATAYFWYLRCMDVCNSSSARYSNNFFEKALTKEQILQVQAAAADKSVDSVRELVSRGAGRDTRSEAVKKVESF